MRRSVEKIFCKTPTLNSGNEAKASTRIPKWKYDTVRAAILQLLKRDGEVYFTELLEKVGALLNAPDRADSGSLAWLVTTEQLHMETGRNLPAARKRSPAPCGDLNRAGFQLPSATHKLRP